MTRADRRGPSDFLMAALLCLTWLAGCEKRESVWETVVYRDANPAQGCVITIYSHTYGENARSPDEVTIYWDGAKVFSGRLPSSDGTGITGMPFCLAQIHTGPGEHVLKVEHKSDSQVETLHVVAGQAMHFMLFGQDGGKEVLLKDLGPEPMFI